MRLDESSVIAIAVTLILAATLSMLSWWMMKLIQSQNKMNQQLTHLLVSKDLATFSSLTEMTNSRNHESADSEIGPVGFDDATMADFIAQRYSNHGIDPANAYSQDDDDVLQEFGGSAAFR